MPYDAFDANQSHGSPDGDLFARLRQQGFEPAGLEYFDFDGTLLGFDDGDDVAARHRIAGLLQPLDKCGCLHVGAQRRHAELSHGHRAET